MRRWSEDVSLQNPTPQPVASARTLAAAAAWQLHHAGITVADLERSIRFYRDVLGFTLVRRRSSDAPYLGEQTGCAGVSLEMASLQFAPGAATIELVQYMTHGGEPCPPDTPCAGSSHLCFQVADMHGIYESLRAEGVRFKTEPVRITSGPNEGGLAVYFFDPDGCILELFQPSDRYV